MEKTYEELKAEAEGLGIEFKGNTSKVKLAEMIEAYYESQSADDLVAEVQEEPVPVEAPQAPITLNKKQAIIVESKRKAMKTSVVRITSNDKRDNDVVTTAYLSAENEYFGKSKLIPLDTPVELEECLIKVAKSSRITLHVDEVVDGKRTGNKVPKSVRKYNVSYEQVS